MGLETTIPGDTARRARHAFAPGVRLVFAHRGGARLAPENTMAAFVNGMARGSDGIECDVQLSRDGEVVVIHDSTLDRTTDATGPVSARTADELARVDAGVHFATGAEFPFRGRGHGVPRLADVLRRLPEARVIVEMKQGGAALARAVVDVVRRAGAVDRVCVGSFYRDSVDVLRREAPEILTSAAEHEVRWTLYRAWCRWPLSATRRYGAFQVPVRAGRLKVISPAFIHQAHLDRARVDVWVVDSPTEMSRLFAVGVDGVITDRPDLAVPARDAWLRLNET